jgi:hypothetical protein
MATLPISKLERIRTPLDGHDDFLYRVVLGAQDDSVSIYYALADSQRYPAGFPDPPIDTVIRAVIEQRASGWLSNYEDEDGTVIEQLRARAANGRRAGGPDGSFDHPFVITPDPK